MTWPKEPFSDQFLKDPYFSWCEEHFNDLKTLFPQRCLITISEWLKRERINSSLWYWLLIPDASEIDSFWNRAILFPQTIFRRSVLKRTSFSYCEERFNHLKSYCSAILLLLCSGKIHGMVKVFMEPSVLIKKTTKSAKSSKWLKQSWNGFPSDRHVFLTCVELECENWCFTSSSRASRTKTSLSALKTVVRERAL